MGGVSLRRIAFLCILGGVMASGIGMRVSTFAWHTFSWTGLLRLDCHVNSGHEAFWITITWASGIVFHSVSLSIVSVVVQTLVCNMGSEMSPCSMLLHGQFQVVVTNAQACFGQETVFPIRRGSAMKRVSRCWTARAGVSAR